MVRMRQHRNFPLGILVLAVLTVSVVHIWQRVQVIELAKEVGTLRAENQALLDDTKKINSEISRLSMAAHIETFASEELGMSSVTAERLYTLVDTPLEAVDSADEFAIVVQSLKRLIDYLPATSEAHAISSDLRPVHFDTPVKESDRK